MKNKILRFIALAMAVAYVIMTIYMLGWSFISPKMVPDMDLSKCPPLTSNPKRLWAYWREGLDHLSIFSTETVKMWRHFTPGWEIRLLTYADESDECHLSKFIPKEYLPKTFDNMTAPLSSDAIRIALIRLHGGVYMDVTTLLLEPLEEKFWDRLTLPEGDPNKIVQAGFYMDALCYPGTFNGLELWMIAALPEEPIIVAWHELFLKMTETKAAPFMRNETTKELNPLLAGAKLDHLTEWAMNYLCALAIFQASLFQNATNNERFVHKTNIIHARDTAFRLTIYYNWEWSDLYEPLTSSSYYSSQFVHKFVDNTPVTKLIRHAWPLSDQDIHKWRIPYNLLAGQRYFILKNSLL
jgi:hypothetical protein